MPGWLTRSQADVPPGDLWLGPLERPVLDALRIAKRRGDWRLGRWTAKAAVGAWLGVAASRVQVLAAGDGAPEAYLDGAPARVSVSLSHRAGRALAVVDDDPAVVGCDLELVEPRSLAFVEDWLSDAEREDVTAMAGEERDRVVNAMWTAKEAAAKVLRAGLRLDVRHAVVDMEALTEAWAPAWVAWRDGERTAAWLRAEPGWVMAIAGEPAPRRPSRLSTPPAPP
jgi:4'-phosphopantetheinyl transferase